MDAGCSDIHPRFSPGYQWHANSGNRYYSINTQACLWVATKAFSKSKARYSGNEYKDYFPETGSHGAGKTPVLAAYSSHMEAISSTFSG